VTERTELELQATRLEELLKRGDTYELQELVEKVHPSDLADILEELDEEQRLRLIGLLPASTAGETLAEMEEVEHPEELLAQLEPEKIAEVVEEMPDDDAADLIGELEPEEQARVLASLEDPSTIFLTAGEALSEIRRQAREIPGFYTIFVVDRHGKLRGVMNLQSVVMADSDQPVSDLIEDPPAVVPLEMDQEEVGRILARYNLAAIGVVDALERLVGCITFDDVIDVMEAETTEDILRFASVSEEEELRGSTVAAVKSRLPWLVLSLITAALASSVVYLYRETIQQIVILAAVMPVIAALGGNAGTQALAVTIRRIALSDESLIERWAVVTKELAVGLLNGLMIGAIAAFAGLLLVNDAAFGLVVMLAMWGNLVVASTLGGFIPIFLESVGVDPAVASSVFVTTLTDLAGFFLLLALASALLL
jgi:magnesium transporter